MSMTAQRDGDDALTQWVREQFTHQRCVRWLDGANPVARRGGSSFVQVIYHDYLYEEGRWTQRAGRPRIWSVFRVGIGDGSRSQVSMKVNFHSMVDGDFRADIAIESPGAGVRVAPRRVTEEITFSPRENAPKKLNAAVRTLRRSLFERPSAGEDA
jgi:hypothetical protein